MSLVETLNAQRKERLKRFEDAAVRMSLTRPITVPNPVNKTDSQVIQQLRAEVLKWRRKYEALVAVLPQKSKAASEPVPLVQPTITIQKIKALVAATYEVDVALIDSDRREQRVVRPRHIAMYLSVHHTRNSLPAIGRHFGGRDHTTVIHADRRVATLREGDPEFDAEVRALENKIGV